ncbi:FixH family protein [Pedobacter nototheniae]|uniref:FixH family protein n=1 Tax=Pedobacter nototheniae TaxID=2488994 RepID=UPI0013F3D6C3|nr:MULTISPECIES: FixH family protein [Pedobacter]
MNWGTKIVMGMVTFMLFIVGMVIYMFVVHGRDALIEENYYEKGINYNEEYNAKQNTINDNAQPNIQINKQQIIISLKDSASYKLVLMRAANNADDLKYEGNTIGASNLILIDRNKMGKGLWFLNLQWQLGKKEYQFKKNIML